MKLRYLKSLVVTVTFLCVLTLESTAQNSVTYDVGKEQYRIIAYQNNDTTIQSVSNVAELVKESHVFLPNAFTPDQDGVNDMFGAVGMNVTDFHLQIFNRWGELIFEADDINEKWDGTFQGSVVQEGVYIYVLKAKESISNLPISKKGTVTLII